MYNVGRQWKFFERLDIKKVEFILRREEEEEEEEVVK